MKTSTEVMPTTMKPAADRLPLRVQVRRWLYEIRCLVTRYVWWPLTHISQVLHPAPVLSGLIVLFLLWQVGQMHEIYLAYLGSADDNLRGLHIVLAAGALALLSAALYFANYSLSDVTIQVVWSEHRDVDRDRRLRACRNVAGFLIAFLPWAGVALGIWSAGKTATANIVELKAAADVLHGSLEKPSNEVQPLMGIMDALYAPMLAVVAVGLAVALFLNVFRRNELIRGSVLGLIALLFFAAVVAPTFMDGPGGKLSSVEVFRTIGPLAMVVIDVLLVFACVTVVTLLARAVGIPLITVAVVIALVGVAFDLEVATTSLLVSALCAAVAVLALLSGRRQLLILSVVLFGLSSATVLWRQDNTQPMTLSSSGDDSEIAYNLKTAYEAWLNKRESARAAYKEARPTSRYPVFIIAAEGGGIYAATAAATFLSRLQERCPSFAQHVFAISGVSGGSVGAAVFQSAVQEEALKTRGGCQGGAGPKRISETSDKAIRDDHLSPLLGLIVADLLGRSDRANGLERSLVYSSERMSRSFDKHWAPTSPAPALVLNATWVETGYRVAFAPFTLQVADTTIDRAADKVTDKVAEKAPPSETPEDTTLHSFRDKHFADLTDPRLGRMTLAGAAVVSARFPAILPAFILRGKGENRPRYWNFVDGGYKDSSGALTALALFNTIKKNSPGDVAPRLILLTSKPPRFEAKDIYGTSASDLLSPLITMLRVRDRLAEEAVLRTVAHLTSDTPAPAAAGEKQQGADNAKVVEVVETEPEVFKLTLGWRISDLTHKIVSVLMGDPDLGTPDRCDKAWAPAEKHAGRWMRTLMKNSCVMRSVVRAISLEEEAAPRPDVAK